MQNIVYHSQFENSLDVDTYSGAHITQTTAAAMGGTVGGMRRTFSDTTNQYVENNTISSSTGIIVDRFYINVDNLSMVAADNWRIQAWYTTGGVDIARTALLEASGIIKIITGARNDAASYNNLSSYYNLVAGDNTVETVITRSSSAIANDGTIEFILNGTSLETVTGIDNYDTFTDFDYARLGAFTGIDAGTSGYIEFDQWIANDSGEYIGVINNLFDDEFESDISELSDYMVDGGSLGSQPGAAMGGSAGGLKFFIENGVNAVRGQMTISLAGRYFRNRFSLNAYDLTIGTGDNFILNTLYSTVSPYYVGLVHFGWDGASFEVGVGCYNDSSTYSGTSLYNISTSTETLIEVLAIQAATSVSSDGEIHLWIDDVYKGGVTGVDNYDLWGSIDRTHIGAVTNIESGSYGTFYIDNWKANDDGSPIGPVYSTTGPPTIVLKRGMLRGMLRGTLRG